VKDACNNKEASWSIVKARAQWGKSEGPVLDYTSQTRDQQRFTILELAADWHEWMILQAIHYAAIHCLRQRTIGPDVQEADIPPPQSATLGLHSVAHKLLLIYDPAQCKRLSWPEHAVG